ncbi:sigma-70 family RNA polymerase sigma factor [Streptomyces sp. NBC_00564]|uniref:RNA polymerase sigma factor n=1 Tax=unclassified Streptomyces TaxID=2593676 RepID=UPI002FCD8754|nr:sigma-70 family RNA polymerase sigma factor [Streptomyces sp. NBC_00564]
MSLQGNPGPDPVAPYGFDVFYRAEYVGIVRTLRRGGVRREEAEDAAQEAMFRMLAKWPTDCSCPAAWVRKAAWNAFYTKAGRDRKRHHLETFNARRELRAVPVPGGELGEKERVLGLIAELPPRQREVLALAYDGRSIQEIAEHLGIKPGTVRSNLRHARETLRKALEMELGPECGPDGN